MSTILFSCKESSDEPKPEITPSFEDPAATYEASAGETIQIEIHDFDHESSYTLYLNDSPVGYNVHSTGSSLIDVQIPGRSASGQFSLRKDQEIIPGPELIYHDTFVTSHLISTVINTFTASGEGVACWVILSDYRFNYRLAGFRADDSGTFPQLGFTSVSAPTPDSWIINAYYPNGMAKLNGDFITGYEFQRSGVTMNDLLVHSSSATSYYKDGAYAPSFKKIISMAVDNNDAIYTVERGKYGIQKVTASGIEQFAGSASTKGNVNADGAAARFTSLRAIAIDNDNNIFLADSNSVRMVTPAGTVSTLAGTFAHGDATGAIADARFNNIRGIAVDTEGKIYVADYGNRKVKVINRERGTVRTVPGITLWEDTESFAIPMQIDIHGNIFMLKQSKMNMVICIPEKNIPETYTLGSFQNTFAEDFAE